jgi:hypothetical protein
MRWALAFVALVTKVAANSSGTGSCAAGIASVGGTHLNFGPTSSPLRDGGVFTLTESFVSVSISGVTLTPGIAATFDSGVDLAWTVSSPEIPYKGIFVRIQAGTDNVFTLTGDGTGLSSAALCDALTENVMGVNHNTAAIKSTNSGVMNFVGSGSVSMDVTIVFDNTVSSVYASSNFPLTIGGAPVAPVPTTGTASPAGVPTPLVSPGTSPPAVATARTIQEIIESNSIFSRLGEVFDAIGYGYSIIARNKPVTLFAPDNSAFSYDDIDNEYLQRYLERP